MVPLKKTKKKNFGGDQMEFGLWSVNANDALLIQRALLLRNVATVVIHSGSRLFTPDSVVVNEVKNGPENKIADHDCERATLGSRDNSAFANAVH